jgi:hypothetical protein
MKDEAMLTRRDIREAVKLLRSAQPSEDAKRGIFALRDLLLAVLETKQAQRLHPLRMK